VHCQHRRNLIGGIRPFWSVKLIGNTNRQSVCGIAVFRGKKSGSYCNTSKTGLHITGQTRAEQSNKNADAKRNQWFKEIFVHNVIYSFFEQRANSKEWGVGLKWVILTRLGWQILGVR